MSIPAMSDLVAHAYEAACDTAGMSGFVAEAATYFGAQQSALTIWPNAHPEVFHPITHGISGDEIRELFAERHRPGSLYARIGDAPPGEILATHDIAGDAPNGESGGWARDVNVLAGVVTADRLTRSHLLLFRHREHGEYSPSECDALRLLMGYLRRAIELNRHLVKIFVERKTAMSILDKAPRSIVILGQNGQVTYQNRAAQKLLANGDGLCLRDGALAITDPDAFAGMESFLETARTAPDGDPDAQRLMILVPRSTGGAPFRLVMYRLPCNPRQAAFDDSRALAVALAYDPSSMTHLNDSLLKGFYHLTHAEIALVQALYDGRTLPEASGDLGISVNTARTQLSSIFKKIGVHSQAALLQELAKSFIHA